MRYYLDTNILVFLFTDREQVDSTVFNIIADEANTLYTSSICVMEAIQVFIKEAERQKPRRKFSHSPSNVITQLKQFNIKIVHTTTAHIELFANMPVLHSDPNDRFIIAQAASDRIALISSDNQFEQYAKYLKTFSFIHNKR